jgi:hypothetical protein
MEERNAIDGYRNAPHSHSVDNFGYHTTGRHKPQSNNNNMPNSTSYLGNQLRHHGNNSVRSTLPHDYNYMTLPLKPKPSSIDHTAPPRPPPNTKPEYRLSRSVESRSDREAKAQKRLSRSVEGRVNGERNVDDE